MTSVLIATTRAFSSDFKSIYEQMAFLGEKYDKIYLVHNYSTERHKEYIEEVARIKIEKSFSMTKYFEELLSKKFNTWREFYDSFDPEDFLKDIHIDDVWFFGAPQSDGGKLKRGAMGLENHFDKHSFMSFLSVSKLYFINYILLKIARVKGSFFHELCYDPGEASVNELTLEELIPPAGYQVYHGYDIAKYDMKKDTSYQYGLKNVAKQFPFNSKIYDVAFGYSYMNKERKKNHELIQSVMSDIEDTNILCESPIRKKILWRSKPDNYDTLVSKDEYMSLISESRFTFVLPAYKEGVFSCSRFMEAIFYDCLPLVFDHCVYKEFFESYNVSEEIYEQIIINEAYLNPLYMEENKRLQLLEALKEKILL